MDEIEKKKTGADDLPLKLPAGALPSSLLSFHPVNPVNPV
jgi:hypothetical protein